MTAETATLGMRLAEARRQQGWSLREAERRSGVPNAHISQIETGAIQRPGAHTVIRLGDAYEIPAAELLAMAGRGAELAEFQALRDRGTALREEITGAAKIEQELGDGYGEMGGDEAWDSANRHWGRAESLREVLATMDRMEARTVTAFTHKAHSLSCDGRGCLAEFGPVRNSITELRRQAAKAGWTVNVGARGPRQDFCPEHTPDTAATAGEE